MIAHVKAHAHYHVSESTKNILSARVMNDPCSKLVFWSMHQDADEIHFEHNDVTKITEGTFENYKYMSN